MLKRALIAIAGIAALLAARGFSAAQLPPDQMTSLKLPEPSPNWVFVLDGQYPALMLDKIHIIDGDTLKLKGQLSGGLLSSLEISPDRREIYMADTYYSRGWHGQRTDVVTIFDAKTLDVTGEVVIPPKRILIVPKPDSAALTPDGNFMLVANMTPATSVSVVDLKARKFVGEIDTPGCAQVLAGGNRRFASMCGDGSLLTVDIDDAGKLKNHTQTKPFFDPNTDPVFDQPVMVKSKAYFISYHGTVRAVDLAADDPAFEPEWSVLGPADRKQSWRPGGWQVIAANGQAGSLFVMMHQGGEWTHKQFGKEVWVFDAASHRRVKRIKLKTEAYSIMASDGPKPLLFGLSLVKSQLETYSLPEGKYLGVYKGLGMPFIMYGP